MKIVIAGGTFCKKYDPVSQKMIFGETLGDLFASNFKYLLCNFRLNNLPQVVIWKWIDSGEMTYDDRQSLCDYCLSLADPQLVIIHGTDTMELSAQHFQKEKFPGTVIFTGAWTPLACKNSDAEFNLGFAMACVKLQPAGVYIAMGGECLQNARKNWKTLRFE